MGPSLSDNWQRRLLVGGGSSRFWWTADQSRSKAFLRSALADEFPGRNIRHRWSRRGIRRFGTTNIRLRWSRRGMRRFGTTNIRHRWSRRGMRRFGTTNIRLRWSRSGGCGGLQLQTFGSAGGGEGFLPRSCSIVAPAAQDNEIALASDDLRRYCHLDLSKLAIGLSV